MYIVLKKIGIFNAEEVRRFNDENDAKQFAKLLRSSEPNSRIEYSVWKLVE